MKITLTTLLFFLLQSITVLCQIPDGYYNSADGLSGTELKAALHNIIDGHTEKSYSDLWDILKESDEDPDNSSNFILIYTGRSISKTSSYPDWNREHVWAKSHGDFGTTPPAGTDAHHIRPCDVSVNSSRGNKDFDEGGTQHSEATECYYTSTTWEPRDAVKGDVARMMFYMVVRYEGDVSGEPDLELVDYITSPTEAPKFGVLSTLLKWNQEDPVDDFERHRNNVVYSYQNNRNPFIDHPEYVTKIWGGNLSSVIENVIINPKHPSVDDEVIVSASVSDEEGVKSVTLKWGLTSDNLNNSINMGLSGENKFITLSPVPAQQQQTEVFYKIAVIDSQDVVTNSETLHYIVEDNQNTEDVVLLFEDFETTTENQDINLEGWINYIEKGTKKWLGKFYSNNKYAQVSSYNTSEENIIWLITPPVNLDVSDNEIFKFDINVGYWKHNGLQILMSQDFNGSDISLATWTDITSNFIIPTEPVSGYGSFEPAGEMNLSTYQGTIYIAYKYSGNSNNSQTTTYQIDNVSIVGQKNQNDETAPDIYIFPANNSTSISIDTSVTILSNESLYCTNGDVLNTDYIKTVVTFAESDNSSSNVECNIQIKDDNKLIVLTPVLQLKYNTSYAVFLNNNAFSDTAGNKTSAKSVKFITKNNTSIASSVNAKMQADVYPNPGNGIFNLTFQEKVSNIEYSVYNTAGILVEKNILSVNGKSIKINLKHLKKGVYLLMLKSQNHIYKNIVLIES
jgi:endonuclease I